MAIQPMVARHNVDAVCHILEYDVEMKEIIYSYVYYIKIRLKLPDT